MPYVAKHCHAPVSARKARLIADMVRGMRVSDALATLFYQPQRAAKLLHKVVRSAQANAEDQGIADVDSLFLSKVWVDEGATLKRWRPRARGGAAPILRRRSHLCVELDVAE